MGTISAPLMLFRREFKGSSVDREIFDSIAALSRSEQIGATPVELSAVGVRSGRFMAVVSSCRNFARPGGMRNPTDVLN